MKYIRNKRRSFTPLEPKTDDFESRRAYIEAWLERSTNLDAQMVFELEVHNQEAADRLRQIRKELGL